MKNEATIQNEILSLGLGRSDLLLFRLNSGSAWQCSGKPVYRDGGVFLPGGRPVKLLPAGTPDVGGVVLQEVRPWEVGTVIARPVFIEVKAAKGHTSKAQDAALATMERLNIRAGVARSVEDAVKIIDG